MLAELKKQLKSRLQQSIQKAYSSPKDIPPVELEEPADKTHGELSTNIALRSAKVFKKNPLAVAEEFCAVFQKDLAGDSFQGRIARIEVKKPGFINFYLTPQALSEVLEQVLRERENFGRSDFGAGERLQIEFVSANPTGPLSVAHARQAAVGDALANVLNFLGFAVAREYYVNDEGNQINILGESVKLRALELLGEAVEFPENGYQGEYIRDMAGIFLAQKKIESVEELQGLDKNSFTQFGVDYLMDVIRQDLEDFGVRFDVWAHQSKLAAPEKIRDALDILGHRGFLYEKDGALWFRSTDLNDDKDRVLEKSDGTYTYLAPDIAYHKDKFERGFRKVINIWGPDHHGYIARLKAAVEALGYDREALTVLIVQLATIFREGKPLQMSTRRGQYISLREVIDEVGVDAARFFFLMRHRDAHLDFDLELAKKQTPENPVYYIQYAHARVNSMDKKAEEAGIKARQKGFSLLKEPQELDLIKKLGGFEDTLLFCCHQWDPYPLAAYLQELAANFHKFYECHRVVDAGEPDLSSERLALCHAAEIILAGGLKLLGLSTPERM